MRRLNKRSRAHVNGKTAATSNQVDGADSEQVCVLKCDDYDLIPARLAPSRSPHLISVSLDDSARLYERIHSQHSGSILCRLSFAPAHGTHGLGIVYVFHPRPLEGQSRLGAPTVTPHHHGGRRHGVSSLGSWTRLGRLRASLALTSIQLLPRALRSSARRISARYHGHARVFFFGVSVAKSRVNKTPNQPKGSERLPAVGSRLKDEG